MQAVILAGGRGARMQPITNFIPKPLIRVDGKNFIERNIDLLPEEVDEVVIVVNYLKEQIINHFGSFYKNKKITYVQQGEPLGTADALWRCKSVLKDEFLVMMSDDLYSLEDLEKVLQTKQNTIAVQKNLNSSSGGLLQMDEQGRLLGIVETKEFLPDSYINTALYKLYTNIFEFEPVKIPNSNEYGLPQTLCEVNKKYPIKLVESFDWKQTSNLEDLQKLQESLQTKQTNPLIN